jgi:5-methylcytosine-specific restriction endonuclease McrA
VARKKICKPKKTPEEYRLRALNYSRTHKEERKRYRQERPEQHRVYKHNKRARKKAAQGTHTHQEIQEQYKRQKGKCYYCSIKLGKEYHADHVVPLSRGGSNDISNIVLACPFCNESKGAKSPHEWARGNRLM